MELILFSLVNFSYFLIFILLILLRPFNNIFVTIAKAAAINIYITMFFGIITSYHFNRFKKRKYLHKLNMYLFVIFSIIHTTAHLLNYSFNKKIKISTLSLTGIFSLMLCLIIIYSSFNFVIRKYYKIFQNIHFLNDLLMVILTIHIIKFGILFILSVFIRLYSYLYKTIPIKKYYIKSLTDSYVCITFITNFNIISSDEIYLVCYNISSEYHPFTVIDSYKNEFTLLINFNGNWKSKFKKCLNFENEIKFSALGSFSSELSNVNTPIFICQGIGITPAIGFSNNFHNTNIYIFLYCENLFLIKYIHEILNSKSNVHLYLVAKRLNINICSEELSVIKSLSEKTSIFKNNNIRYIYGPSEFREKIKKELNSI